jgi:hypothetical protein
MEGWPIHFSPANLARMMQTRRCPEHNSKRLGSSMMAEEEIFCER